jgi:hypothetical protein
MISLSVSGIVSEGKLTNMSINKKVLPIMYANTIKVTPKK